MVAEKVGYRTVWTICKYADQRAFVEGIMLEEPSRVEGNLLLNEGITALLNLLTGAAETAFSNANSYIGVGDSAVAAAPTQSGLQAAVNKLYKAVEAGFPSIASQTITWRAIFGSGDANFDWNEFTIASGNSDAADNLNRRVSAEGTKAIGQIWTLDVEITWS